MHKAVYSTCQGVRQFHADWSKYILITLQLILAVSLCYMSLSLVYSVKLARGTLEKGNIENNFKVMALFQPGTPVRFAYTPNDIATIESFFGDNGTVYFIHQQSIGWRYLNPSTKDSNLVTLEVFYTSGLQKGEYLATANVKSMFLGDNYTYIGIPFEKAYVAKLQSKLVSESIMVIDDEQQQFILRHQVVPELTKTRDQIEAELPEAMLYLPLDDYFESQVDSFMDRSKLLIYFDKTEINAQAIGQTLRLLREQYDGNIRFVSASDMAGYRMQIEGHDMIAKIFLILSVGIFTVVIIELICLVTTMIKKRIQEICIRLCVGVRYSYVYWEIFISLLIPLLLAGMVGVYLGNVLLERMDVVSVPIVTDPLVGLLTIVIILLTFILVAFISVFQLRNTDLLHVINEE